MDWVADPVSGSGLMSLSCGNSACIMKNVVNEPTAVICVLLAPAGTAATDAAVPLASTMAPARMPRLTIDPFVFHIRSFVG